MRLLKWLNSFFETLTDPMFSTLGPYLLDIQQELRRIEIKKQLASKDDKI